jgi:hypothetical protein
VEGNLVSREGRSAMRRSRFVALKAELRSTSSLIDTVPVISKRIYKNVEEEIKAERTREEMW